MARRRSSTKSNSDAARRKFVYRTSLWLVVAIAVVFVCVRFVYPWLFAGESELDRLTSFQKQGELTFLRAADGSTIRSVDIQIADSDESRQTGLMGVRNLTDDRAMLFVFPDQSIRSFWMKYTKISLDIVFADSSGEIVGMHKNTTPMARKHYHSVAPAMYVVEVQAGFTDRFGVTVGDKMTWSRL